MAGQDMPKYVTRLMLLSLRAQRLLPIWYLVTFDAAAADSKGSMHTLD